LVGSNTPLDFATLEQHGHTLFVDTSGVEDDQTRDLVTTHLYTVFLDYIKRRGVGPVIPWSFVLEEVAILLRTEALVPEVEALANEYRNNRLQSTISFQSTLQLHEQLRGLLYSFGTHWIGRTSSAIESDMEADSLLTYAPQATKYPGHATRNSWGMVTGQTNPMFFTVQEQRRLLADALTHLQGRQFMVRTYLDEATIDPTVNRVLTTLDLPDTSAVTEDALLAVEEDNLKRYARPIHSILAEVDSRLQQPVNTRQPTERPPAVPPKQLA